MFGILIICCTNLTTFEAAEEEAPSVPKSQQIEITFIFDNTDKSLVATQYNFWGEIQTGVDAFFPRDKKLYLRFIYKGYKFNFDAFYVFGESIGYDDLYLKKKLDNNSIIMFCFDGSRDNLSEDGYSVSQKFKDKIKSILKELLSYKNNSYIIFVPVNCEDEHTLNVICRYIGFNLQNRHIPKHYKYEGQSVGCIGNIKGTDIISNNEFFDYIIDMFKQQQEINSFPHQFKESLNNFKKIFK